MLFSRSLWHPHCGLKRGGQSTGENPQQWRKHNASPTGPTEGKEPWTTDLESLWTCIGAAHWGASVLQGMIHVQPRAGANGEKAVQILRGTGVVSSPHTSSKESSSGRRRVTGRERKQLEGAAVRAKNIKPFEMDPRLLRWHGIHSTENVFLILPFCLGFYMV